MTVGLPVTDKLVMTNQPDIVGKQRVMVLLLTVQLISYILLHLFLFLS